MIGADRYHRGFTLIEVLVCLALMSLIVVLLVSSIQLGGRTWSGVTRTANDFEQVARAQDFLRRRLSEIHPWEPSDGTLGSRGSLVGSRTSLQFSGPAPNSSGATFMRYELSWSSSRSGGSLEVRYCPQVRRGRAFVSCEWIQESILGKLADLSFQFWDEPGNSDGHWVSTWNEATRLPRLIRIDVRFGPEDRRRWPPLYVEPRIDANAACRFDVVSRSCRETA